MANTLLCDRANEEYGNCILAVLAQHLLSHMETLRNFAYGKEDKGGCMACKIASTYQELWVQLLGSFAQGCRDGTVAGTADPDQLCIGLHSCSLHTGAQCVFLQKAAPSPAKRKF